MQWLREIFNKTTGAGPKRPKSHRDSKPGGTQVLALLSSFPNPQDRMGEDRQHDLRQKAV